MGLEFFWYITTGLAIALLGVGVQREFPDQLQGRIAAGGVCMMGLFMALSGIFPGDFVERSSLTMGVHTIGSLGGFVGFLFAGFTLPKLLRHRAHSRLVPALSLLLVWGGILAGFLRSGEAPGLGQRLGFACVLLWVALVGAWLLSRQRASPGSWPGSAHNITILSEGRPPRPTRKAIRE